MDPNETLKNLRAGMAALGGNIITGTETNPDVIAAWEAWEALDEWLSNGSFLPAEWLRNHTHESR